jgi:hypothetical protein
MMSKMLTTKSLVIILVLIAALLLLSRLFEKKERTFRSELITVDTAAISGIRIIPKSGDNDAILMTRSSGVWNLEKGGVLYSADQQAVKAVLTQLVTMKVERVASNAPEQWNEFQVTDTTGTRVQLMRGKKSAAELYIGKFNYQPGPQSPQLQQQSRGKMSTFVRLGGDDVVYVVDGFLKTNIQADVNNYRNKNLCNVAPDNITRLTFRYPNSQFSVERVEEGWEIGGQPADSTQTAKYLQNLQRIVSSNFVDDAAPLTGAPSHYLKIEGNNILPVELKAFPADTVNKYIVTSSANPDAHFSGEMANLFGRIFKEKETFFEE